MTSSPLSALSHRLLQWLFHWSFCFPLSPSLCPLFPPSRCCQNWLSKHKPYHSSLLKTLPLTIYHLYRTKSELHNTASRACLCLALSSIHLQASQEHRPGWLYFYSFFCIKWPFPSRLALIIPSSLTRNITSPVKFSAAPPGRPLHPQRTWMVPFL